jgi:ABC-type dipeptide/oligopeptide/nickel transport system permease component
MSRVPQSTQMAVLAGYLVLCAAVVVGAWAARKAGVWTAQRATRFSIVAQSVLVVAMSYYISPLGSILMALLMLAIGYANWRRA